MFEVYGIEKTRAQLCAARATVSDIETARIVAEAYAARGLVANIHSEELDQRKPIETFDYA